MEEAEDKEVYFHHLSQKAKSKIGVSVSIWFIDAYYDLTFYFCIKDFCSKL